jgi:hypothetical protein
MAARQLARCCELYNAELQSDATSAWLHQRFADDGVPEAGYQAVDTLVDALAAGQFVDLPMLVTILAEHERDCLADDSDTVRH